MVTTTPRSWLPAYVALGITWGCSFLFIKWSLGFLSPVGVAFGRCALGALTLAVILKASGQRMPRERIVWAHLWVIAMCMNVVPGVLFALAETRTTSILAGIINALTPLTALFFITVVFRDDSISRRQIMGLVVGMVGVLVVLGVWRGLGQNPWWAVASLLLSVSLYGVAFPYTRRHILHRRLSPVSLASAQLLLASLTLLPMFFFSGLNGHRVTFESLAGIIALGAFGSGLAYMWNFRIIAGAGSSIASTVTYLTPVVAVIVGVGFLHESLSWFEPVGGVIVLLGAAIGQGRFVRR